MYEKQWLSCDDPERMLAYMLGKTGDRKLRLFACACVRQVWGLLRDDRSRRAVLVAEHYADRQSTHGQLCLARTEAREAVQALSGAAQHSRSPQDMAAIWAARAAGATVQDTGFDVAADAAECVASLRTPQGATDRRRECEFIRETFGNPFRRVSLSPQWLAWNHHCVVRLAQTIYEQQQFDHLPILGDALEEAGCDNEEILWHCRDAVVHARGCWVVDAILGKN
jgi:hypothetical protein